jgi:hypothetical protein
VNEFRTKLIFVIVDMYYGGNNIGRWAGASIPNMYTDGTNLHFDGLPNEPKHSHLATLHNILAQHNTALMGSPIASPVYLGNITFGSELSPCATQDVFQNITFSHGQILNATGFCLDGACSDLTETNCYPAPFVPCTGAASQSFQYSPQSQTFVNAASGGCLDALAQTGPEVGIYKCIDQFNQQWTILAATSQIQSHISGSPCLTASPTPSSLQAYVYENADDKLTFLVNLGSDNITLTYQGFSYYVPGTSVSLVEADGSEVYNTAKVNVTGLPTQRVYQVP